MRHNLQRVRGHRDRACKRLLICSEPALRRVRQQWRRWEASVRIRPKRMQPKARAPFRPRRDAEMPETDPGRASAGRWQAGRVLGYAVGVLLLAAAVIAVTARTDALATAIESARRANPW